MSEAVQALTKKVSSLERDVVVAKLANLKEKTHSNDSRPLLRRIYND